MKSITIQFPKDNREFITVLRKRVNEYFENNKLSKYGNLSILLQTGLMLSLYLVPYMLMLTGQITSWSLIFSSWIVMGFGMAGIGMVVMHDANHGSFSRRKSINRFLSKSLYLLGGYPPNWQFQHNTLHHGYTNIDGHDEDISPPGFLRFSPHKPHYKIHRMQHLYAWFFYGLMTLSWITIKDFNRLSKYKKMKASISGKRSYRTLLMELVITKVLYYLFFLFLPILIIPVAWYWIIIFFLTMHFVAGITLSIIFQTAHVMPTSQYPVPDNEGFLENDWAIHQLLTTSDFSPESLILSWFIGGLNYQVEHHLFPNICHVHYRKIAPLVKRTAKEFNLPYFVQPNFGRAIFYHGKMLRLLGR